MLEYTLRNSTEEYQQDSISQDNLPLIHFQVSNFGAMHGHRKMLHPTDGLDTLKEHTGSNLISTIFIPQVKMKTHDMVNFLNGSEFVGDKKIMIRINSTKESEIVCINRFLKINQLDDQGDWKKFWKLIWPTNDAPGWSNKYKTISEMPRSEVREWASLVIDWHLNYWVESTNINDNNWLTINAMDIINNFDQVILDITNYCGLTLKTNWRDNPVINMWLQKQKEIISNYLIINQIVDYSIRNKEFKWANNFMMEILIQKKLRDQGYEIKCDGLEEFPTDSMELHKLLWKGELHQ